MKRYFIICLMLCLTCSLNAQVSVDSYDPMQIDGEYICGRAWDEEIGKIYVRLPERMKADVSKNVWALSRNAAGLSIHFKTDSRNIRVRYSLAGPAGLNNMSTTDHSGVDLYATDSKGRCHWLGTHLKWYFSRDTIIYRYLDIDVPAGEQLDYELYLPPYNTVTSLQVQVDQGSKFAFLQKNEVEKSANENGIEKPIVVYGTSIVQGASPSRPGLMFTNIVRRNLGLPLINLGFSGSALLEPAMFKALGEINARIIVIDAMPNAIMISDSLIRSRLLNGIRYLRKNTQAPILLVECYPQTDVVFHSAADKRCREADACQREVYEQLLKEGMINLYYLSSKEIGITEDAMVEGCHPNDIGNLQYAKAYEKALKKILK